MCGRPRSHLLHSAASLQCFSLPRFNIRVGFHITFLAWSKLTARCGPHASPSPANDLLHQRLRLFRHPHDCSNCCRMEREWISHWEIAPSHGARFSVSADFFETLQLYNQMLSKII